MYNFISGIDYKDLLKVLSLIKNKGLPVPEYTLYFLEALKDYFFVVDVYVYIEEIDGFEVFQDLSTQSI
ncbi:hypothetical protein A4U60_17855 [Priestia endophytica]|nr:hypothetical protein A4U60_17855 [Priestia endophytica]